MVLPLTTRPTHKDHGQRHDSLRSWQPVTLIITRLLRCWVKTSMGNMQCMPEIITIKQTKKDYQPLGFSSLMKIQPQEARGDHQASSAEKEQALQLLPKEGPPHLGSTCHAHRAWVSGVAEPLPNPMSSFLPFHHPARLYFLCDSTPE